MTKETFSLRIIEMQKTLYHVAYSLLRQPQDREDAVQECIRKAWEKQGRLREEKTFRAWVTRILINECYNILRHQSRVIPRESLPETEVPQKENPVLHDAILRLNDKLRVPIVLYYMEGYEVADIAKLMRIPLGTVKTRLLRARKLLEEMMKEEI